LGRSFADKTSVIRQFHVESVPVGFRVDGYGAYTELLASADDSTSDFASVGDQDLVKHRLSLSTLLRAVTSDVLRYWPLK
jgi:hypothetical protein